MNTPYDQLFSELEGLQEAVLPPRLQQLYEKASEYQTLLSDASREGQDGIQLDNLIEQCVAELDAECPFNNQVVKVTGQVRRSYYDEINQKYVDVDMALDQTPMIARGFYVVTDDDQGEYSYTVGHYFEVPNGIEVQHDVTIPFAQILTRHYAFAPVGSVDIEYERTREEKLASLEASIPEVIAEFDTIVLNADDECDALRRLRYMKFDARRDIPGEVVKDLLGYAHDCLQLDMEVPYVFELQGFIKEEGEDQDSAEGATEYAYLPGEPKKVVGYVTGLMIDSVIAMRDGGPVESQEQHWHAILHVLPKVVSDQQVEISVPVRGIRSMSSLRRTAYGTE
jgi:hypothetical protein